MSTYGQFCPISKATEVLGERWTLLLVRELLMGSHRFNELQRGLAKMSPSLLTKRLKELEQAGLISKTKISGQKGFEYHLSKAGQELGPVVMALAKWGMKWATDHLSEDELDVELLMWDIRRNINSNKILGERAVLKFHFKDMNELQDWWIVINNTNVDLCTENPGHEPDLYITTDARTLTQIWMGSTSWSAAKKSQSINLLGSKQLAETIHDWLASSPLSYLNTQSIPR